MTEQQPQGEQQVTYEVPDIKVNMKEEQIKFIQHLFDDPKAGLEWVNKTFDSLKDGSGTIPRATLGGKIKAIAMGLGTPEPRPQDLESAVAEADPNGYGQITYDEFKKFCVIKSISNNNKNKFKLFLSTS